MTFTAMPRPALTSTSTLAPMKSIDPADPIDTIFSDDGRFACIWATPVSIKCAVYNSTGEMICTDTVSDLAQSGRPFWSKSPIEAVVVPIKGGQLLYLSIAQAKFLVPRQISDVQSIGGGVEIGQNVLLLSLPEEASVALVKDDGRQFSIIQRFVLGDDVSAVGSLSLDSYWAASNVLTRFSVEDNQISIKAATPIQLAHTSRIHSCIMLASEHGQVYITAAQGDRHVHVLGQDRVLGSMAIQGPVLALASDPKTHLLACLYADGVSVYELNAKVFNSKKRVAPLKLVSQIKLMRETDVIKGLSGVKMEGDEVVIVRSVNGVQIAVERVEFKHGDYIGSVERQISQAVSVSSTLVSTKRYKDIEPRGEAKDADEAQVLNVDGNLAELSLGERIKPAVLAQMESHDEIRPPPTQSLAVLLSQALHSGDVALLETCLATTHTPTIRTSVRRLQSPLAVPLLTALMDRLGKGGKGSGARGKALSVWMTETLSFHTAYLLSVPDLVQKLAGLHALLSRRLAAHQELLALKGRLTVVCSQLNVQQQATQRLGKKSAQDYRVYVESDSEGNARSRRKKDNSNGMSESESESEASSSSSGSGSGSVEIEEMDDDGEVENLQLQTLNSDDDKFVSVRSRPRRRVVDSEEPEIQATKSGSSSESESESESESDDDLDDFDEDEIDSEEEEELMDMANGPRPNGVGRGVKARKTLIEDEASEGEESSGSTEE